jgi:ADP-ribosylglycohydrolase
MAGWTSPFNLLHEEFIQRRDEGCVIPERLVQRFRELSRDKDQWNYAVIDPLYDELMALEPDAALAAKEPNELAEIRALRPEGPRDLKWKPSDEEALDRFHGAWTGRAVGCALGKPVEGMGMSRDERHRLNGRKNIRRYLEARGDWPLRDYFSGREAADGQRIGCELSHRERIAFMEADDDIHYSLTGLGVVEQKGPGFDWADVGRFWLANIPPAHICTAETQAVTNLQMRSARGHDPACTPAFTRRHRNPYREWIGAQIRADGFAWVCAGKPELAAEFAWRDASWTHERNGIYGEMMFAAMQAAAFVEKDPARLVEIGLSEIPRDCRLAHWTRECLKWVKQEKDFEGCMDGLEQALPDMHVVHTINNALICVLSLFYGGMDTTLTPVTAVMCGLDTDCNGATVGSIVGAISGKKKFGGALATKLNDTIKPNMLGFQQVAMSELAQRTLVQWKRVDEYWAKRQGPAPIARKAAAG